MTTYIALFRAINVAGKQLLPMPSLRALMEGMGLEDVRSYIQSGNVVFRSDGDIVALVDEIADAVMSEHGFKPQLLLLDAGTFVRAVKVAPFAIDKSLHICFLLTPVSHPDLERLEALKSASESFELLGEQFYLYAPDGVGRSRLVPQIEKALGVAATGRNGNTVSRLLSMVEGGG